MEWSENKLIVEPPKKPKKITGTRLAAILGANRWNSPFKVWCELTRTYEESFEDNIYTTAGKVIEPKLIDFVSKRYFLHAKSAEDVYGKDFFKKTYGDFFRNESDIFGGMWDAIANDAVIEIKTTKRSEDWLNGAPEYYKLQAALYAWLLGVDRIIFCCGFLKDEDYEHPEDWKPNRGINVITKEYSLKELYPDFEETIIKPTTEFWFNHVLTGISPEFTKADEDIIKALKNMTIESDDEMASTIEEIEKLLDQQEEIKKELKPIEDKLKAEQKKLKDYMTKALQADASMKTAEVKGSSRIYTLSKSVSQKVDEAKLKKAGIYNDYLKETTTYTLRTKQIKEEK